MTIDESEAIATAALEPAERRGARSFGAGNIEAPSEAVEREQALRGTP